MDDHREHLPVVLPVKGVLMKKIGAITVGQAPRVDVTPGYRAASQRNYPCSKRRS